MAEISELTLILAEKKLQQALLWQEVSHWALERAKLVNNHEKLRWHVEKQEIELRSQFWALEDIKMDNQKQADENEALRLENQRLALQVELIIAKIRLRTGSRQNETLKKPDQPPLPQQKNNVHRNPIGRNIKKWMKRAVAAGASVAIGMLLLLPLLEPAESCGCGE